MDLTATQKAAIAVLAAAAVAAGGAMVRSSQGEPTSTPDPAAKVEQAAPAGCPAGLYDCRGDHLFCVTDQGACP